jgi:hypothetical protein
LKEKIKRFSPVPGVVVRSKCTTFATRHHPSSAFNCFFAAAGSSCGAEEVCNTTETNRDSEQKCVVAGHSSLRGAWVNRRTCYRTDRPQSAAYRVGQPDAAPVRIQQTSNGAEGMAAPSPRQTKSLPLMARLHRRGGQPLGNLVEQTQGVIEVGPCVQQGLADSGDGRRGTPVRPGRACRRAHASRRSVAPVRPGSVFLRAWLIH